ncbi:MAG: VWA domain-containing protein [Planctomycetes bacterium]|nr:VWA domain-containing protein [Planctomycetota bacterium]
MATVNHAASGSVGDIIGYDEIVFGVNLLPNRRELIAWGASLAVNLLLLVFLSAKYLEGERALVISEIDSKVTKIDLKAALNATIADSVGSNARDSERPNSKHSAPNKGQDLEKQISEQLQLENLAPPIPPSEPVPLPQRDKLLDDIVANGDTIDTGGTEGALDILTQEIEYKLKQRKTLVIWLLDASLSLNARRAMIAKRIETIYSQLRQRNKNVHRSLKTAVVSYGEKTTFLTEKPVDGVADVVKAIQRIKPDESGFEFLFTAIDDVMKKWRPELDAYRSTTVMRRNVMLIIVTDERGNDYAGKSGKDFTYLDKVVGKLRFFKINVYCVGNAAVFGREKAYVSFKDKNGIQWENCEVDQGPETVAPERLQLKFWGRTNRDLDKLSANYGPFAITRLCAETSGRFLITEHSQGAVSFPQSVMRRYRPFYGSIKNYMTQVSKNRAKMALYNVAGMTIAQSLPRPQLAFQANNDNILRQQMAAAQRPLARLNYRLTELLAVLEDGEKSRAQIKEPRWQAGYDLAMGRLLAMQVRAKGYQSVLAEMSSSPLSFKKKGNNQWQLVPSRKWETYAPRVKKIAKRAKMYLKRVINEHPDTPWALIAEHELSAELGWEWQERKMNIATRNGNGNNPNQILLANETLEQRRRRMRKKQMARKKPKL